MSGAFLVEREEDETDQEEDDNDLMTSDAEPEMVFAARKEEEISEEHDASGSIFEDNPMPILRVEIPGSTRELRVLIDSGAGVNLISSELSREIGSFDPLDRKGLKRRMAQKPPSTDRRRHP